MPADHALNEELRKKVLSWLGNKHAHDIDKALHVLQLLTISVSQGKITTAAAVDEFIKDHGLTHMPAQFRKKAHLLLQNVNRDRASRAEQRHSKRVRREILRRIEEEPDFTQNDLNAALGAEDWPRNRVPHELLGELTQDLQDRARYHAERSARRRIEANKRNRRAVTRF